MKDEIKIKYPFRESLEEALHDLKEIRDKYQHKKGWKEVNAWAEKSGGKWYAIACYKKN